MDETFVRLLRKHVIEWIYLMQIIIKQQYIWKNKLEICVLVEALPYTYYGGLDH